MPEALPIDDDWRATHYLRMARQEGECLCLGNGRYYPTWHRDGRRSERIAELICRVTHGPRPDEHSVVALSCVNKACISTDHVSWATQSASIKLACERGHVDPPHPTKLSRAGIAIVLERLAKGEKQTSIALDVGVSPQLISDIKLGKRRQV